MMNISCFFVAMYNSHQTTPYRRSISLTAMKVAGMIEFISRVLFIIPPLAIHTLFHHGSTVVRKIPEVSNLKKHDWDSLWEWLNTIYVYHLVPLYAPKKKNLAPSARRSAKAHGRTCPRGAPVWKMIKAAFNLGLWFLRGTPPNSHNTVLLWCPPIKQPFVVWCGWHY